MKTCEDPTYNIWAMMKTRCTNKDDLSYPPVGGKGIGYCKRWQKYENFLIDMGRQPFKKACLGRIDRTKDYSKENCMWMSKRQLCQSAAKLDLHTARVIRLSYKVQNTTYRKLAYKYNVDPSTIRSIVLGLTWSEGGNSDY